MKLIHILLLIFIFLSVDVCVTVKEDEKNVEEILLGGADTQEVKSVLDELNELKNALSSSRGANISLSNDDLKELDNVRKPLEKSIKSNKNSDGLRKLHKFIKLKDIKSPHDVNVGSISQIFDDEEIIGTVSEPDESPVELEDTKATEDALDKIAIENKDEVSDIVENKTAPKKEETADVLEESIDTIVKENKKNEINAVKKPPSLTKPNDLEQVRENEEEIDDMVENEEDVGAVKDTQNNQNIENGNQAVESTTTASFENPTTTTKNTTDSEIKANIIDSFIFLELSNISNTNNSKFREKFGDPASFWHSSLPQMKNSFREVLEVTSVVEDVEFNFGENIILWKTLQRKFHSKHVLVGMTINSIVLLTEHMSKYEILQEIELEQAPKTIEIYMCWDEDTDSAIGVVIVSIDDELIWYELRDNFDKMEEVWRWKIHKNTIFMKYFIFKTTDILMIITEATSTSKTTSAELYEFSWEKKDFWIFQIIPLEVVCNNIAIIESGTNFIIGIPQNDIAMIYKYNATIHHNRNFVNFLNITSQNLTAITGFKIGGHSYLAVGGLDSQILRYYKGSFYPQTILSQTFGVVEYWLPIPARTYRDDLILLVQHRIDFTTHSLTVLEALIWNGEAFTTALEVPCLTGETLVNYGLTCMLDLERVEGIVGATVIQHGKNLSLIVPRFEAPSGLFRLNFQLASTPDPVLEEMEKIRKLYDSIADMLEYQNYIIAEAEQFRDQIVLSNCEIESISAPIVEQDDTVAWLNRSAIFGNHIWTLTDSEIHEDILSQQIRKDSAKLDHFYEFVKNSASSMIYNIGNYTLNGDVNIINLEMESQRHTSSNMKKRQTEENILRVKTLYTKVLNVDKLYFDTVNDIPAANLIYKIGNTIHIDDPVVFRQPLNVTHLTLPENGLINSIDFKNDIVVVNKKIPGNLKFSNVVALNHDDELVMQSASADNSSIKTDVFVIDGNVKVEEINNVNVEELLANIVLTNIPYTLDELDIEGELIIDNEGTTISQLNGLEYPVDYLFTNGPAESIITGRKSFLQRLRTSQIDTTGTIDGVDVFNLITLDSPQTIPMETTFQHLEVTETIEVDGEIKGRHLDDFLENPNILQTNKIEATCLFQNLIVEGPIYVNNQVNGTTIDELLADVVYRNQQNVEITSIKYLDTVEFKNGVTISSELINDINVSDFVTKSTEQTLDMKNYYGNLYFDNLEIEDTFDGVNISNLEYNSVKLSGNQYTGCELIIDNSDADIVDIDINHLEIRNTLNSVPVSEYIDISENFELYGNVEFTELLADNACLDGTSINGTTVLNDIDLVEFDNIRFSLTREQTIETTFLIPKVKINGNLSVDVLNNVERTVLSDTLYKLNNMKSSVLAGDIPIENCYVEGNLFVESINGHNIEELKEKVIWLDRPNEISGNMKFIDPITFENIQVQGRVNDIEFDEFLNDIVYKTDQPIEISGTKVFKNTNLIISEDIDTVLLNNKPTANILTKNKKNLLSNNVNLIGNIIVDELIVKDSCNSVKMEELVALYEYNKETKTHIIKADIEFNNPLEITDLVLLNGNLNGIPNITDKLIKIPKLDYDITSDAMFIFKGSVFFEQDVNIGSFNGYNLSAELSNIVRIDEATFISGEVVFTDTVTGRNVEVANDLISSNALGCDFDEWLENGLLTDRKLTILEHLHFVKDTFQANNITVETFNDRSINDIVTLHTDQSFEQSLVCDVLYMTPGYPINVYGQVNGMDLRQQKENTFMTYGNQNIDTPVAIHNARVLKSMDIRGTVNDKYFNSKDLVQLDEPEIIIQSPISIELAEIDKLWTQDSISNINFISWYENSLWKYGKKEQTINTPMRINNLIMQNDIDGNGVLNGVHIDEIYAKLELQKEKIHKMLEEHDMNFLQLCNKVQDYINLSKTFSYYFKFFEFHSVINIESNEIISSHIFTQYAKNYLLINSGCQSQLYQWDAAVEEFVKLFETETGLVDQWITLTDPNLETYLVSRTSLSRYSNCQHSGLNVWKFDSINRMTHLNNAQVTSDINQLHENSEKFDQFYVLMNENQVIQYDLNLNVIEEWKLPISYGKYGFLPSQLNQGLALGDGKKIVLLNSVSSRTVSRSQRDVESDGNAASIDRSVKKPALTLPTFNLPAFSLPTIKPKFTSTKSTTTEATTIEPATTIPATTERVIPERPFPLLQQLDEIMKKRIVEGRNYREKVSSPKRTESTLHQLHPNETDELVAALPGFGQDDKDKKDNFFQSIFKIVGKMTHNAEKVQSYLDERLTKLSQDENIDKYDTNYDSNAGGEYHDERSGTTEEPMSAARKVSGSLEVIAGVVDTFINGLGDGNNNRGIGNPRMNPLNRNGVFQPPGILNAGPSNARDSAHQLKDTVDVIVDGVSKIAIESVKIRDALASTTDNASVENVSTPVIERATRDSNITKYVSDSLQMSVESELEKNESERLLDANETTKIEDNSDNFTEAVLRGSTIATNSSSEEATISQAPGLNDISTTISEVTEMNTTPIIESSSPFSSSVTPSSELRIAQPIPMSGISVSESDIIPEAGVGELLILTVGEQGNQKNLIAVTSTSRSTVPGNHDVIRIYDDVFNGKLFQTLSCHRPASLTAINMQDETVLAFIENAINIKIFIYRGISGFVISTQFKLTAPAIKLFTLELPQLVSYKCPRKYLATVSKNDIKIFEAKITGNCGLDLNLNCDNFENNL